MSARNQWNQSLPGIFTRPAKNQPCRCRPWTGIFFAAILCIILPINAMAGNSAQTHDSTEIVALATLNWPPYTGTELPGSGYSTMITRNAFAASGIDFVPVFYPWRRVLDAVRNNPKIIGYYPEYRDPELERIFYFSDPIGSSPLGFVYLSESNFDWTKPNDLMSYEIGIVAGYVNAPQFDHLVQDGDIRSIKANDDLTLLRLLQAHRIDAAVMDEQVMQHLIATHNELKSNANQFIFHPKRLDTKSLHVVFRHDEVGRRAMEYLNAGLAKFNGGNHVPTN